MKAGTPTLGKLGIPGQNNLQERLAQYLRGGRLHPAVILSGTAELPKWQLAKNIAKSFICAQKSAKVLFCDQCNHCRRIEKETHPDVLLYQVPDEDVIKIDTVRDFCHQMAVGPIEQNNKICIIDECHRMNAASANAFLKTLEEPGEGRYFWLLTSQVGSLLPTILSRCLKFQLLPEIQATPPSEEWAKVFQEFLKTKEPFRVSAQIDSKEKALDFVHFLQHTLHRSALLSPGDASDTVFVYDETVELEGRLRSNANYALMLESFLSQNF